MLRPSILLLLAALPLGPPPANAEPVLGLDREHLALIEPLVAEAIGRGDLPGCVVAIGRARGGAYVEAFGQRSVEPAPEPMTIDTVFDLASLTKPVATATCAMRLVESGRLRLRDRVADLLPGFGENGKADITVEQLLLHTAGFIPDNALEDYDHGADEAWRRIDALQPQSTPGEVFRYSDVGFLVLGRIIERLEGRPLDQVAAEQIFGPLQMTQTAFNPPAELRGRIAPTTREGGEWLRGRVHDPRAARLGGVAGHAGLFSTAGDLSRYARMMLAGGELGGARVLSRAGVAEMTRPRPAGDQRRALGWDIRSTYSRNRGELMSPAAFGHGGFTGTGMWVDPELDLFVVFLSNRLHPDGEGSVNDLIGRIGTIAAAAVRAEPGGALKTR